MGSKPDKYYINKIIEEIDFVLQNVKDITFKEFNANQLLVDSVCFRFIQISEHCDKISDEYKNNTRFPWRALKGLRNKLVHEYGIVIYDILYDTIINDLENFKDLLMKD